jgi:hypothetical protein
MFFSKLNLSADINDFKIGGLVSSFKLNKGDEFKGTAYHTVNNNDHLFNLIPYQIRPFFSLKHLKINCAIWPHIDHGPKTSINIYLKTNNCKTTFYSFIDPSEIRTVPLNRNNLKETDSFIAKDGDIWLLDISTPHSVELLDNNFTERIAFCFHSHLRFNDVLPYFNTCK